MSEPFYHDTDSFLHIQKWQNINKKLRAGFTTRIGGVSKEPFATFNLGLHVPDDNNDVVANRRLLANNLAFPLNNWVAAEQVHSANTVEVNRNDKGKGAVTFEDSLAGTDGIFTNESGLLCTAFFADCVPLFFFDPVSGYIGIAHAGWKGTVKRIAEKMVEKLLMAGSKTNDILVVIGPCISQKAYEVDTRVVHHIPVELHDKTVTKQGDNRYLLDLKQLNTEILLQCGILRHNIDITNYCTFQEESLFFSHRRDNGKTGRMLGYIGYLP